MQIDATGSLISFLRFALEDGAEGRELQLLGDYIRTALRLAGGRSSGCAGGIQPAIPGEVLTGGQEGRSDNLRLPGRAVPGPEGVKVISVPATEIATEHGAIQAANTAMFGALMQAGNLGLPREAYCDAFRVTFAKKPRLIPKNLEILEAGAGAVRVLEMAARK